MADEFNLSVIDTYKEHWCHQSFHTDCSTCFSENKEIVDWKRTHKVVNHEDLLNKHPALKSLDSHINN